MEIKIIPQNDATVAQFIGRLDTPAAQEISSDLTALQEAAAGKLILDCKELAYISSSGLRIFLTLRKTAAVKGGKVTLRGINDDIRNVVLMTGFLNLFDIEE
jgi:anti-sigma B factor antagonist